LPAAAVNFIWQGRCFQRGVQVLKCEGKRGRETWEARGVIKGRARVQHLKKGKILVESNYNQELRGGQGDGGK
jgi:hypothetical protein